MSAHLTGRIECVMAIYTETKKSVLWYFELYLLTLMYLEDKCKQRMCYHFLAYLSTKCSRWAFVMAHCPSSVRPCVNNFFKQLSSETTHWILTKLHMNDPWVVLYHSCSKRSSWLLKVGHRVKKIGFHNAIFKNLVWNYKAQSFYIWCITSSKGPLPIFGGQH